MKKYFELFITFSKVGALTFGGGYTMLPILQKEVVQSKQWVTYEEIMDYYAIGQCTPGIIAVNTSIFIGYKIAGWKGAIASSLGIIFPSITIILLITIFLKSFMTTPVMQKIFTGIRIVVCALVIDATMTLYKKGVVDKYTFCIFFILTILLAFEIISVIPTVIIAAICGVITNRTQIINEALKLIFIIYINHKVPIK